MLQASSPRRTNNYSMRKLDFAVPIGLSIGVVAIVGTAVLEGIKLSFLFQPTAMLVVFGGTVGAVVVRRGPGGLKSAFIATVNLCIRESTDELEAVVARLQWLARTTMREGVRVIEAQARQAKDPLVSRALTLASEYAEPLAVREALNHMLEAEDENGTRDAATIEAAGGYAPTFGILGAVLGLISVLRSINDPAALGSGIATAFVATLYGVGIANLLLFPIASRLRERHEARMKRREALAHSLTALAAHESPSAIASQFAMHASPHDHDMAQRLKRMANQ